MCDNADVQRDRACPCDVGQVAGMGNWEEAVTYYAKAAQLAPGFSFAAANEALGLYQVRTSLAFLLLPPTRVSCRLNTEGVGWMLCARRVVNLFWHKACARVSASAY